MTLYKNKYRNESARLPGWDYASPGYYFLTVCTYDRACIFGHIDNGEMVLNECGQIVLDEWDKSFIIRRELVRDEFVVMPNHFHGIVKIVGPHVPVVGRTAVRSYNNGPARRNVTTLRFSHHRSSSAQFIQPQDDSSFVSSISYR